MIKTLEKEKSFKGPKLWKNWDSVTKSWKSEKHLDYVKGGRKKTILISDRISRRGSSENFLYTQFFHLNVFFPLIFCFLIFTAIIRKIMRRNEMRKWLWGSHQSNRTWHISKSLPGQTKWLKTVTSSKNIDPVIFITIRLCVIMPDMMKNYTGKFLHLDSEVRKVHSSLPNMPNMSQLKHTHKPAPQRLVNVWWKLGFFKLIIEPFNLDKKNGVFKMWTIWVF